MLWLCIHVTHLYGSALFVICCSTSRWPQVEAAKQPLQGLNCCCTAAARLPSAHPLMASNFKLVTCYAFIFFHAFEKAAVGDGKLVLT
jgi:hypothetical protein